MENEDVTLWDVYLTAHLFRTSPRGLNGPIRLLRRNEMIVGCYEVGNVTVEQVAGGRRRAPARVDHLRDPPRRAHTSGAAAAQAADRQAPLD
jgi:hypothetical protein